MSKETNTTTKQINWSAIKTNVIIALFAVTIGLVGGYFTSINVREDARNAVVNDMQIVAPKAQK